MAASQMSAGAGVSSSMLSSGAGVASSVLVSGGSIAASALADAVGQVKAMVSLLSSPEMQAALGEAQALFGDLGSQTFTAMQPIMQAVPVMQMQSSMMTNTTDSALQGMDDNADVYSGAIENVSDTLKDEAESLFDYIANISLGDDSSLENPDKLERSQNRYMTTLAAAQKGDVDAFANMQDVTEQYRDVAKQMFGDSEEYSHIEKFTRQDLTALAANELGLNTDSVAERVGITGGIPEVQTVSGSDAASQLEAVQRRLATLEDMLNEQRETNRLLLKQIRDNNDNAKQQVAAVKDSGQAAATAVQGAALAEEYA
ncbi:MAG: hypothetical protein GY862_09685 [Gammaproteobacteria bacterium]|nr:hypothetical protein [Gammaproteobacteria bacterium]